MRQETYLNPDMKEEYLEKKTCNLGVQVKPAAPGGAGKNALGGAVVWGRGGPKLTLKLIDATDLHPTN